MNIETLENYCISTLNSIDSEDIENRFKYLLRFTRNLAIGLDERSSFWRARALNNTKYFNNVSELEPPPKELVKEGRMNNAKEPIFYLANRQETALAEINIRSGETVQVAQFSVVHDKELKVAMIGAFWLAFKNGSMPLVLKDTENRLLKILNNLPPDKFIKTVFVDKFLANVLADVDANKNEYLHTRILSKLILSNTNAHAIGYPSVKDEGGYNVAVKADTYKSLFQNTSCSVLNITKVLDYGIYVGKTTKLAEDIDKERNFIWKDLRLIEEDLSILHNLYYNQKGQKDRDSKKVLTYCKI